MYIVNAVKLKYDMVLRVVIVACCSFLLFSGSASAATLGMSADSMVLSPGETTTLRVLVNTEGVAINNAEAKLIFPTDLIEIVSTSKSNSVMTVWVEDPSFSNTAGTITFNSGIPTPGYIGTQGTILSIDVRAKKAGRAEFVFSNTAVRANDGFGTNVLTSQSGIALTVFEADATHSIVPASVAALANTVGT